MKFNSLNINRLPGLKNGLEGYGKLARNINIVAGPNGSGKSSTARLIQEMLWWKPVRGVEASAELDVEGEHHRIEINASGYIHYDKRNLPSADDFSYITPQEFANQYMLALHDLVNDSNEDLAKTIVRELNGGLDLKSAAAKLNYSDNRITTKKGEYTAWREASEKVKRVSERQQALKDEEKRLAGLKEKRETAREATRKKEFYKLLADYLAAQNELEAGQQQLATYPRALAQYREGDLQTVIEAKAEITGLREKSEKLAEEIKRLDNETAGLKIAGSEAGEAKLSELKEDLASLERMRIDSEALDKEILSAETVKANAGKRLEPYLPDRERESLSMDDIHLLDDLARKANGAFNKNNIIKEEHKRINNELKALSGDVTEQSTPSAQVLSEGINHLSKWLKEEIRDQQLPQQNKRLHTMLVYSSIIGVITGFATLLWEAWGLSGLFLLLIGLLFIGLKKENPTVNQLEIRQKDYEHLALKLPTAWSSEAVSERLSDLIERLNIVIKADELRNLLIKNREELDASEKEIAKIKEGFEPLKSSFAGDALFAEAGEGAYSAFFYFINHLIEWQKASTELNKKKALREKKQQGSEHLLAHSNGLLQSFNYNGAGNITELKISIAAIEAELKQQKENRLKMAYSSEALDETKRELTKTAAEQESVYHRLNIEQGNDDEVEVLAGLWDEYRSLVRKIDNASSLSGKYKSELRNHPLYKEEADLLTMEEVLLLIEETESQAAEFGKLVDEIARIEEKIQSAQTHSELEEAIAKRDNTLENLDTVFEENLQSITGNLIINQLRKEVALNNDNPVFREANRILGNITRHRYSLSIEDSDSPVFRAIDNIQGLTLGLNELSTGTRVQLLLAVRLAYIQSQEAKHKVKLPLLADELLANSDDERSEVIIDSLIEISRSRQVFYFTAQGDEVAHWQSRLEAVPDISFRIIFLGESRPTHTPLQIEPIRLRQTIPPPEALSHHEYGEILNVPPYNPIEQSLPEIHLWYIIEDTEALYRLLERGIATWGQLQQFLLRGGKVNDGDELEKKAGLLDTFIELYRIGRPKTINREVLEDSKAVSDVFIDEVSRLLEEAGHNPLRLLESLKTLHGFRKSKIDDLREYLINKEYIDERTPLSKEEIAVALQAECSKSGLSPEAADTVIRRLFA